MKCCSCLKDLSYFKLNDRCCNDCISIKTNKLKRIYKYSPFNCFLFVIGIVSNFFLFIRCLAENTNEINSVQGAFSFTLLIIALTYFFIVFIIRFYIARCRVNLLLSLVICVPLLVMIVNINEAFRLDYISLTSCSFVLFPFFVLRVPNLNQLAINTSSGHYMNKLKRLASWYNEKTDRQVNVLRLAMFIFGAFPVLGWIFVAPWLVPLWLFIEYHRVPDANKKEVIVT